jgi:hypothetical protein
MSTLRHCKGKLLFDGDHLLTGELCWCYDCAGCLCPGTLYVKIPSMTTLNCSGYIGGCGGFTTNPITGSAVWWPVYTYNAGLPPNNYCLWSRGQYTNPEFPCLTQIYPGPYTYTHGLEVEIQTVADASVRVVVRLIASRYYQSIPTTIWTVTWQKDVVIDRCEPFDCSTLGPIPWLSTSGTPYACTFSGTPGDILLATSL